MKMLFVLLVCSFLVACATDDAPINTTQEDLGDLLNFTFESTNFALDDSIVVLGANTTKEVYLFAYCGIPLSLVRHDEDGQWRYVYPYTDDCAEPTNQTLTPNMTIPLADIPTRDGGLTPGEYRLKLFYSTFGPSENMREFRQIITIRE